MKLLKDLSTFKIGGPVAAYAEAKTTAEMQALLRDAWQKGLPVFILGKGSNCLFSDRGFPGLVIHNKIDFMKQESTSITVGAGFSFALLGVRTAKSGLAGLEFASGIPASVGGALFMNAGASGGETADHLVSADFVDEKGELHTLQKEELVFAYRKSSFQEWKGAIVSATFELIPDSEARNRQLQLLTYRQKTQPYSDPSIGCIFRNPTGPGCLPAAALIDQAGLKRRAVGGAEVSAKHANFIVNPSGTATAQDVEELIAFVKQEVYARHGVHLEEEIRKIGFES